MRRAFRIALVMALLVPTAGCLSLDAAEVPPRLLTGSSGNGWEPDPANSTGPASSGVFAKKAQRAYRDDATNGEGYPAMLVVTSFRTLISPDTEELTERTRAFLETQSQEQGYSLEGEADRGERTVAGDRPSRYFVFTARAEPGSDIFERDSTIKVLGEVFRCRSGANVIAAATAQVNSVRYIGGVAVSQRPDATNWAELVADPSGTIDGHRGSNGLVYNIEC